MMEEMRSFQSRDEKREGKEKRARGEFEPIDLFSLLYWVKYAREKVFKERLRARKETRSRESISRFP